ncbi:P2R1A-PPP2R2A-interacting phosphatase regulator 1 isoform X1 [Schistocerca serialis cubense]|uniref:P2R1A-PPP2R2A-interacting phosphatase regulator 1 isoform X1 n=1 Tax=Schistocerca serialis cubense TaxID=2023355 RepID=UPI00214E243C|nr:P2R1A-PPP2R2A-interacting phosphatase regulator 1 isoform X1 [Schistocerca serialis cubense]
MDVDSPVSLKRSSSAPMINELNTTMSAASTTSSARDSGPFGSIFSAGQPRTRRFSASFSPVHNMSSGALQGPRLTPRVSQLRQEECLDREAAHEREIHSAMQMSQSWEDLTLVPGSPSSSTSSSMCKQQEQNEANRRMLQRYIDHPLQLSLPNTGGPPVCSSPSPTRQGLGRQCFSPGFFKNSLSPSPTRKAFATRRSLSPNTVRASSLGPVKRKCEIEDEKVDPYVPPPAKRPSYYGTERAGLLMTQNNRMDASSSPLPGSLSSVGTPESLSSADSPGFSFRPVDSPSPGRPAASINDEPMQEERTPDPSKSDQIMTQVGEKNPS